LLEELLPELPELDGLELEPLALDGLELMPPELEPLAPEGLEPMLLELEPEAPLFSLFSCACHSERLIWPSWFLSILSNSLLELDDDAPPAAELLGVVEDDVPDDELPFDDLLPCDIEGEEPELDFDDESPAAYEAAAKASSEKLRNRGLMNFMQKSPSKWSDRMRSGSALRPARGEVTGSTPRQAANMPRRR
jgi:hypothetical protein